MINFSIKQSIEDYPTDFRLMVAEAISWLYVNDSQSINVDGHYPIKTESILLAVLDAEGNVNHYDESYLCTPGKAYDYLIKRYQHLKTFSKVYPSIKLDESDKHRLLSDAIGELENISARYESAKQSIKNS